MATNQTPDSVAFLGAASLILFGWLTWHFLHQQITDTIGLLRYGELVIIAMFEPTRTVLGWRNFLGHHPNQKLVWDNIRQVTPLIGHYLRYPTVIILGIMAYFTMFRAPRSSYKKAYSLDRLIAAQAKVWPVISPIIKFNPADHNARDPDSSDPMPADLPMFAEALSPTEWLRFHRIAPYDSMEHERSNDPLDRDSTFYCFAEQLGPRWRSAMDLPWHQKGLFAAFALKAARKRDDADKLLGELAMAANPKKQMALALNGRLKRQIIAIIRDPKIGGSAEKIAARHAYVAPAMMRLLEYSRERGGVLAPATFLWLRGADRALWYPLNNMGRQSFHIEAAGAIAHLSAEKAARSPLFSPKVQAAVDTLEMETRTRDHSSLEFAE